MLVRRGRQKEKRDNGFLHDQAAVRRRKRVTEWRGFTWSDLVYPGTEVYNRLVMLDLS